MKATPTKVPPAGAEPLFRILGVGRATPLTFISFSVGHLTPFLKRGKNEKNLTDTHTLDYEFVWWCPAFCFSVP